VTGWVKWNFSVSFTRCNLWSWCSAWICALWR